jgi:hypothetical protein
MDLRSGKFVGNLEYYITRNLDRILKSRRHIGARHIGSQDRGEMSTTLSELWII